MAKGKKRKRVTNEWLMEQIESRRLQDIADEMGVSRQAVQQRLSRLVGPLREDKDRRVRMLMARPYIAYISENSARMSRDSLARHCGISPSSVRTLQKLLNLECAEQRRPDYYRKLREIALQVNESHRLDATARDHGIAGQELRLAFEAAGFKVVSRSRNGTHVTLTAKPNIIELSMREGGGPHMTQLQRDHCPHIPTVYLKLREVANDINDGLGLKRAATKHGILSPHLRVVLEAAGFRVEKPGGQNANVWCPPEPTAMEKLMASGKAPSMAELARRAKAAK